MFSRAVLVVFTTPKPQVLCRRLAAFRPRDDVIELHEPRPRTALAACATKRATPPVPQVNLAGNCDRNMPSAPNQPVSDFPSLDAQSFAHTNSRQPILVTPSMGTASHLRPLRVHGSQMPTLGSPSSLGGNPLTLPTPSGDRRRSEVDGCESQSARSMRTGPGHKCRRGSAAAGGGRLGPLAPQREARGREPSAPLSTWASTCLAGSKLGVAFGALTAYSQRRQLRSHPRRPRPLPYRHQR